MVNLVLFLHSVIDTKSNTVRTIFQNIVRTALVLLTVFVAIRAPYFGSTLSAVGGLTDAFLSFVMPPLIFRVAMRGELGPYQSSVYLSIVVWGVVVISYTLNRVLGLPVALISGKYVALIGSCVFTMSCSRITSPLNYDVTNVSNLFTALTPSLPQL